MTQYSWALCVISSGLCSTFGTCESSKFLILVRVVVVMEEEEEEEDPEPVP